MKADPVKFMERRTGRRFAEGMKVIMYPSSFLRPSNAAGTKEPDGRAVIYQVGTKSFMVPVTKYPPADSSSSVDKTA